jgi:hypothetical protein
VLASLNDYEKQRKKTRRRPTYFHKVRPYQVINERGHPLASTNQTELQTVHSSTTPNIESPDKITRGKYRSGLAWSPNHIPSADRLEQQIMLKFRHDY